MLQIAIVITSCDGCYKLRQNSYGYSIIKGKLSGLKQFLVTESLLEMMKILLISPEKLYLFIFLDLLVMQENGLKNLRISKNKDNQGMKFGKSKECSRRNIFLEDSYTKCGGETIPISFSIKSKLSIYLDQYSKVLYGLFVLELLRISQVKDYRNIFA